MSYPDFGCYAECLTCEVCDTGLGLPDPPPDLFPDEWPDNDPDPFDMDDWAPPEPDKPFEFDLPGIGDMDILPMNPFDGTFGGTVGGKF